MKQVALVLALVIGLSSWVVYAQRAGDPPDRGEFSRQGMGDPGAGPGEGWRPPVTPIVAALDADEDGVIDASEMAKAAKALRALDENGDKKLTADEYQFVFRGGPRGPEGRGDRLGGPGGFEGSADRSRGRGGFRGPGGPPEGRGGAETISFESAPLAKDKTEKKILAILDQMGQQGRGMMSVPRDDGRYLRLLTEALGAKNVVEVGTSHGYSAIWLCLALRTTGGKLTTFEIDADRAAQAQRNFKRAGVDSIVTLVEGDAHEEVTKLKDPIDLLFLDADKQGYLDYLEKLLPLVRPGGLVVAHNMNARQADPRYVKAITTNPELETLFVNVGRSGIGATLKKR